MQTGLVQFPSYFKGIGEIEKQLDKTNIKILTAMWTYGPRNLLEVSRRTGLPFTSVYHRVAKMEAKSGRIVYLLPETAKLGLVRVVALVEAKPGLEEMVTAALKIPNLWRVINACEGTFTHLSTHAIPVEDLEDFRQYIQKLLDIGLIKYYQLIETGDSIPYFPNFNYYDTDLKQWTFPWDNWFTQLKDTDPKVGIRDPESYSNLADRKDILIIAKLEDNARMRFSEMVPFVETTMQGIKYHWDKRLLPSGLIRYFAFDVYPYPVEVCAYHEVMMEFSSELAMNKFLSIVGELFFVLTVEKVLKRNTLLVLTYIPNSQLPSMFTFFSEMTKRDILTSYSSVRLDFAGRHTQSISYELFDDQKGWVVDFPRCFSELTSLVERKRQLVGGET